MNPKQLREKFTLVPDYITYNSKLSMLAKNILRQQLAKIKLVEEATLVAPLKQEAPAIALA